MMKKRIKAIICVLATTFVAINSSIPTAALDAEHIIDGFEKYEPLFVHTPVISPVTIKDEDGNDLPDKGKGSTQLVGENPTAWYELQLDKEYMMHWDSMTHREILGYGDSGENPSKYDKYTQDKWFKVPFEVLYDGVFYELNADNYTDWIKIRKPLNWEDPVDNHWVNTPIYIPTYAREMGEVGNEGSIFYKVEAINVDGDLAQHYEELEEEGNLWFDLVIADGGAKYVATYQVPVQLSGIIYDFTLTGTSNGNIYADEGKKDAVGTNELSFVMSKNEKKAGTKDRIGTNNVRYLLDGKINDTWNKKNTLPLTDGKSEQYKKMGAVWKGQKISFTFKTIANLWSNDGNKDRIEIVPTFTYYDNSGNKVDKDHLKVFYDNPEGSGSYIEYGTARDTITTNWTYSAISSDRQKGAYYSKEMSDTENSGSAKKYHFGNWADFTAKQYNLDMSLTGLDMLTDNNILNRKARTYCLSHIILNSKLRLYAGEWEQLKWNIKDGKEYDTVKRYCDLDADGTTDDTWEESDTTRFRKSIQQWYGEFYIPDNLYIVDLNKHPAFSMKDYMEVAHGGAGITEDEPIFEKSGYLVVNFDIRTYNEGKPHLKYLGGDKGGNMWEVEGYDKNPAATDPTPISSFEYGDIIVIDMDKSVKDKYNPGIHNVN